MLDFSDELCYTPVRKKTIWEGCNKMDDRRYELASKNAEASVAMEGYKITPEMRKQCELVLRGQITTSECLRKYVEARQAKVSQS